MEMRVTPGDFEEIWDCGQTVWLGDGVGECANRRLEREGSLVVELFGKMHFDC